MRRVIPGPDMVSHPRASARARAASARVTAKFLALAALLCASLGAAPAPPTVPASRPPSLLLITVEGLRPDFLSCYSKASGRTTPGADRIAAEGRLFEQVVTPSASTLPALATLFTGLTPFQHQVWDDHIRNRLDEKHATLAERLKAKGYMTGAFLGTSRAAGRGFNRGFEIFQDGYVPPATGTWRLGLRAARQVGAGARNWLAEPGERPFFLWLHFVDLLVPERSFAKHPGEEARQGYAERLALIDQEIAAILDHLKDRKRDDNLAVVLTADHGFGLGEHGEARSGALLYESTLRVPLLIKRGGPGEGKGEKASSLAGLVDVLPTLEKLLGLQPSTGLVGRDLFKPDAAPRAFHASALMGQEVFGWAGREAIARGAWRLILGRTEELYDISADPKQEKNLAASRREEVAKLKADWSALTGGASVPMAHHRVPPVPGAEILARLKKLGLAPISLEAARRRTPPDAAAYRESLALLQEMHLAAEILGYPALRKVEEPLLKADPENLFTLVAVAAFTLHGDEAARKRSHELLNTAQGLYPLEPEIYHQMAHLAFPENRFSDAVALLQASLELQPRYPAEIVYDLACAYARKGESERAIASLKESVRLGYRDVDHLSADPDLASIVSQPAVKKWLQGEFRLPSGS